MSRDPRSDIELVEICNRGGARAATDAYTELYERHRGFVLRVAQRCGADRDLALDVLQETFGYLLRKFPPAGPGLELAGKLTSLLYPVVKHCVRDARRDTRRWQGMDGLPEAEAPPVPDDEIAQLVATLPEERREVLLLRYAEGFTLAEIAAALDLPLGTVKSRIHLAVKQLRSDPAVAEFFRS